MYGEEDCTCPWCAFHDRPVLSRVGRLVDWVSGKLLDASIWISDRSDKISPPPPCHFDPPRDFGYVFMEPCTAQFYPMDCDGSASSPVRSAAETAKVQLWKAQPEE